MAEHTPGPWSLGPTAGIGQRGQLYIVDADGVRVADCEAEKISERRFARSMAEDAANARLIAAAPDLLAVLEDIAYGCGHERCHAYPWIRAARAAVKKATGEQR